MRMNTIRADLRNGLLMAMVVLMGAGGVAASGDLRQLRAARPIVGSVCSSWYETISVTSFAELKRKYDGKRVSTFGTIEFDHAVPYLRNAFNDHPPAGLSEGICLEVPDPLHNHIGNDIIRRLAGTSAGIYGVYRKAPTGVYANCLNGSVKLEALELEFE